MPVEATSEICGGLGLVRIAAQVELLTAFPGRHLHDAVNSSYKLDPVDAWQVPVVRPSDRVRILTTGVEIGTQPRDGVGFGHSLKTPYQGYSGPSRSP